MHGVMFPKLMTLVLIGIEREVLHDVMFFVGEIVQDYKQNHLEDQGV